MFGMWRRRKILLTKPVPAEAKEPGPFDSLPYIDNDTLDEFLADPTNLDRLPVDPSDFRPEIQRMIVSAFLHEASRQAKVIEHARAI
jgi:hypothetical protein